MRVDEIGTVHVSARLRKAGLLTAVPALPILMYHSVSDDPEDGVSPYYRLATSPRRFREQMAWIAGSGLTTLTLSQAIDRLSSQAVGWDHCLAITFDDGFRDFLTTAKPVLDEFGLSATMFLPTGFIGANPMRFKNRDCLSWSEVKALDGPVVEFGAHTVTHPQLHQVPWAGIRDEVRRSRLEIEDQLGHAIGSFAYPYAFPQEDATFTAKLRDELAEAGYTAGVTTIIGRAQQGDDVLTLKRLPVNDADALPLFAAKLTGAYDWVGTLQAMRRRLRPRLQGRRTV